MKEIEKNKGILYDKEVVDICLELFKEGEIYFLVIFRHILQQQFHAGLRFRKNRAGF